MTDGIERGPRLALDVGSVRVGVAVSDPDGLVATPVETLARDMAGATDVARVVDEVRERGARVVYVGLPRHLSGAEGAAAASAREYAVQVARAVAPVPVHLVDERMSTVSAHRSMQAAGRPGRKQRSVVDQVAAVIILQGALDAERRAGARTGELVTT
ncbi:Holliday junction resolvase RuvX [Luteimicrobium subarcticum]|uniref:Putative pre-16S rRNA nuclease n=1 Tax=Luteimicrobium subarcticum TaxID=620910 RepID=A0A2M8W3Z7_9MICO|nr:Holliday junction resolvase RuvX [Luteimicrobium subarcticum]PJI85630.1 putative Holliday junction resolvase [Luteimicrobium subarcticum]